MAKPPDPTFAQLRALIEVYDKGGFTHAAGGRHRAANKANLVRRLGGSLGNIRLTAPRTGPEPPQFTAAGREVVAAARRVLAAFEHLEAIADDYRDDKTRVVGVAAYPAHLRGFAATAARALKPRVRVRFYGTSDALRATGGTALHGMLTDGIVDIAICPDDVPLPVEQFAAEPLYAWRLAALQPGLEPMGAPTPIQDLIDRPVVCSPPGHRSRERLERAFAEAGGELRPVAESDSVEALVAMGFAGVGWVVLPDDSFAARRRYCASIVLDVNKRPIHGTYAAWYPTDADEGVRLVVDELVVRSHGLGRVPCP